MQNPETPANNLQKFLHVYKGECYQKKYIKKYQRVITFDLDETLGSFFHLSILWTGLKKLRQTMQSAEEKQTEFNMLLDLYPEFLRYGILNILDYLLVKKKQRDCDKIYIYTNNNCTPPWVSLITEYFKYKLSTKEDIFDHAVCAFKINNKVIELSRTTYDKTYADFIKCTLLPKTTEICFLDNTYFSNMVNEKVYYIQPRAYYHSLSIKSIIDRFLHSPLSEEYKRLTKNKLEDFLYDWFSMNGTEYPPHSPELDVFVAQKMMYHIKEFFYLTNRKNKTKKTRIRLTRNTRKSFQGT
jgi:hypothetical protein